MPTSPEPTPDSRGRIMAAYAVLVLVLVAMFLALTLIVIAASHLTAGAEIGKRGRAPAGTVLVDGTVVR